MGKERAKPEELIELFDLLVLAGRVTRRDISDYLGVRLRRADVIIHDLRIMLGNDDTVNLVCERRGFGEPCIYYLAGHADDAKPWVFERLGDHETRLETTEAVVRSLVRATDGRTIDGKLARLIARTIERAREDIRLLLDE